MVFFLASILSTCSVPEPEEVEPEPDPQALHDFRLLEQFKAAQTSDEAVGFCKQMDGETIREWCLSLANVAPHVNLDKPGYYRSYDCQSEPRSIEQSIELMGGDGLPTSLASSALSAYLLQLRYCREQELVRNVCAHGEGSFAIELHRGEVGEVEVHSELSALFNHCVERRLRSRDFPGEVTGRIEFQFVVHRL